MCFFPLIFVFLKGEKSIETVSLWYRRTPRMACCCTVERTNTAVETLSLCLWCEASCTTGEEDSDSPMSLSSRSLAGE